MYIPLKLAWNSHASDPIDLGTCSKNIILAGFTFFKLSSLLAEFDNFLYIQWNLAFITKFVQCSMCFNYNLKQECCIFDSSDDFEPAMPRDEIVKISWSKSFQFLTNKLNFSPKCSILVWAYN